MVGVRGQHRQPGDRARTPVRRAQPRAHVLDHLALALERLQPQAEGQHGRLAIGVIAAWEKYGGTASSSARTCSRVADSSGVRKRFGSDSAGHSARFPQPSSAE